MESSSWTPGRQNTHCRIAGGSGAGDKTQETVEAVDGSERSNGLLAGEGTSGKK